MMTDSIKIVAQNRKARKDYLIEETYEAGLVLLGSEIKSIREGGANLRDSFATIRGGEIYIHNMHISSYQGGAFAPEPTRDRKMLLHKKEIKRLTGKTTERGYTLIPLKLYLKAGRAKIELGMAKGKKKYDKRREMAKRDAEREMQRALKGIRE